MYPYVQTTLTQMEIIKLQTEITRKGIKLVEFGSNRKILRLYYVIIIENSLNCWETLRVLIPQ